VNSSHTVKLIDGKQVSNASDSLIANVKRTAEKLLEGTNGSHDREHTRRVVKLCQRIGSKENVDMNVLIVAAYLHDIGRYYQDSSSGAVCHAKKGARMAKQIINNLSLTKEQKNNILHCIRSHRFRGDSRPETREAMVLFDADKLDAIGAVGVARAFLFAGEVGARLHNPEINVEDAKSYSKDDTGFREFKVKLCKIKERMLTKEGKKIASTRHAFMEKFFEQFLKEYKGER